LHPRGETVAQAGRGALAVYERIVAGTDLSRTAAIATERAALLASRVGAELTLVHAGSHPGDALDDLAKQHDAEAVARPGSPAEVLVSEAEQLDAGLIVVGSVGMSGTRRFLLGSVPNKVSHHAACDVLIVKTDPTPPGVSDYETVLVGTDGSPTAMRAVEMASTLTTTLEAKETIVCAYQPPTEHELKQLRGDPNDPVNQWSAGRMEKETPEEFRWRIAGAVQAEDVLERASERAGATGADFEVRSVEGHPAETLISLAGDEGFDLIAVGSVGMRGPKRFMLGNVPQRVSHHAPTDVLIFKTA
jgi:nucleotide-binding universal stress UspA family protein